MSNALGFAIRGDDALIKAIDEADPDTFGISCQCGCFHIGKFSEMEPHEARCPECGSDRGCFESPALGGGRPSVKADRSPSPTEGDGNG